MSFVKYPPTNIAEAIDVIEQDSEILHNIVHGDENTEVLTENGLVPSLDKVLDEIRGRAGSATAIISEEKPTVGVFDGTRWYKPSKAATYVYYCDGDSCQWVKETVASSNSNYTLDVRAFGAKCDGVTDDTAAVRAMVAMGDLVFPAGMTTLVTDTINIPQDTFRTITQLGGSDYKTINFRPVTSRPLFYCTRTASELGMYTFKDIWVDTDLAKCGTAILAREFRPVTGTQVVGDADFIVLDNFYLDATGGGYWNRAIHMINAGGLVGNKVQLRQNNSATPQQDPETVAIQVECNQANINIIKAISISQYYTQRWYIHIALTGNAITIESIYLDMGEMVGGRIGLYREGSNICSAVSINSVHMDMQQHCIYSDNIVVPEGQLQILQLTGSDLRLGSNGGSRIEGNVLYFMRGVYLMASGCYFGGHEQVGGINSTGLKLNLDSAALSACNFNGFTVGIDHTATSAPVGAALTFQNCLTDVLPDTSFSINKAQIMGTKFFSGDLNALATGFIGKTTTRVGNATSMPSGVSGLGHHVDTYVYDENSAHQVFHQFNTRNIYNRSKAAGTWSSWKLVSANIVTGWVQPTGDSSRDTFNPSTISLEELAKRVSQIVKDLTSVQIIG